MNARAPIDHGTGRSFTLSVGVLASGIVTSALGLLALLGWVLGLPLLATFGVDLMPMAPSTALLFLLYGAAICLRARLPLSRRAFRISVTAGCLGALVAFLLFTLGCLDMQWPVERLGLNATRTVRGAHIGHMSPVTAVCFLVLSVSFLISLSRSATRPWRVALALGSAGVLLGICLVFLLAYLYGAPLLYGGRFIPPALNTILAFAMLGLALLLLAGQPAGLFGGSPTEGSRTAFPLVLIFALLAAGIVATGYIYYRHYEQHHRTEIEHQLAAIAELKVDELALYRNERLGDAYVLYRNPAFSALVRRLLEKPADAEAPRQLEDWLGKYLTHYHYNQIRLLDAQGATRLLLPGGLRPTTPNTELDTSEVLRSGQVVFQDFYRHEYDHRVYLAVLVPILDVVDANRPLGVLVIRIDPATYLYPLIQKWPTPSRTAEILLVRREGNEAVFLNELKFQSNTALNLRVSLGKTEFSAVKAVLGQKGIVEGQDYCGCPTIADVRAVPNSPWFLVARIDSAEVYAPLHERLWLTVLLAGLLLISAGAGAGLLWRQQRVQFYKEQAQAEAALRRSEAKFRTLYDSTSDAVMLLDPKGFFDCNPATLAMFGCATREEFCSKHPTDVSPPVQPDGTDSLTLARQYIAMAMEKGSLSFEWMHKRADTGETFPSEVLLNPLELDGKRVLQTVVRDITERKRSEESLRLQSAALEAAANAIVITDLNGTIQSVNPAFTALTGYTAQEAVGQNPRVLKSGKQDEAFYRNLWQTISSGQVWSGELTNRRKDGSFYAEEMTITPMRNADGVIARYIAIKQDITGRKELEVQMERLHTEHATVLNSLGEGVHWVDVDGRIKYENPAAVKMLGYEVSDLLGKPAHATMHHTRADGSAYPQSECLIYATLRDGKVRRVTDEVFWRNDGSSFAVDYICSPVCDQNGRSGGSVVIFTDVTERKRMEKVQSCLSQLAYQLSLLSDAPQAVRLVADAAQDLLGWDACFLRLRSSDLARVQYVLNMDTVEGRRVEAPSLPGSAPLGPMEERVMRDGAQIILRSSESDGTPGLIPFGDTGRRSVSLLFVPLRHRGQYFGLFSIQSYRVGAYDRAALDLLQTLADHAAGALERIRAEQELEKVHKQLVEASRRGGMAEIATNVLHNVGNVLNSVNISTTLVVESVKQSKASSLARVVGLLQEHAHDLGEFITNDSGGKHVPAHLAQLAEHLLAEQETNARELASLQRNIEHIKA